MRLLSVARCAGSKVAPWVKTKGHFEYQLYHGRDNRYAVPPHFKYDTYSRFFARAWMGKVECYPLFVFCGVATVYALYTIYHTFGKNDLWVNRSYHDPPWDWSRCRSNYWNNNARAWPFDRDFYHQRKPLLEKLEDEMLEAAIKKGTRNPDGSTKVRRPH